MTPPHPDPPPVRRVLVVLSSPTKTVRVHARGLVQRLRGAGADVHLAAPRAVLAAFGDVVDLRADTTVLPLGEDTRPVQDLVAAAALGRVLRGHGSEVVHAHGYRAGAVAALAVRLARPRPALVTTWHGLAYPGASGRLTVSAGERFVARSADVTLAASEELRARAAAVGARDARAVPVAAPHAPDPEAPREQLRAALAEELGLRADVPWVLTVGRIVPEKDHDLLLAATARWRGLHPAPEVLVVGVGAAPVVQRLRRQVREGGLPVRLLGARDDIVELMHASDVFVLTSRWEAPALSVQEAMRAGLPVVATAVGGVPDLVGGSGVLVEPGDHEGFAVEVALLLADPARARELGAAARERAQGLPDEDDVAAVVQGAYADAVAARARTRPGRGVARAPGSVGC